MPFHIQDRIAGCGLVAGLSQEGKKFLARNVVFAEREGLDGDSMLRTFGVEAPALVCRASHHERPGRYPDHDRALRTFLNFSIFLVLGEACTRRSECEHHDHERWK